MVLGWGPFEGSKELKKSVSVQLFLDVIASLEF